MWHERARSLTGLRGQGLTLAGVRTVLKEFHDSIGDEGGAEDSGRARSRVMRLLTALGWEAPEEPPPPPEEPPPPPPEAPSANGVPTEAAGAHLLCSAGLIKRRAGRLTQAA